MKASDIQVGDTIDGWTAVLVQRDNFTWSNDGSFRPGVIVLLELERLEVTHYALGHISNMLTKRTWYRADEEVER